MSQVNETVVTTDYWCAECGETTYIHHTEGQKPASPPKCAFCGGDTVEEGN